MASNTEQKLNRTSNALNITANTDFAAVQLYSQSGNPIYIDGLSWGLVTVAADVALTLYHTLRILRGPIVTPGATLAQILALPAEEIYRSVVKTSGGLPESYDEPIILEANYIYLVIIGDLVLSGALTGAANLFLTVRGRTMPDKPVEKMPTELRSGAIEEPTQYTYIDQVQVMKNGQIDN